MAAIVMIHNQLRKNRSQQTQRLHLPIQDTHPFSYLHPDYCSTPVLFLWQTGNTWQPHQLSAKKWIELTCFCTYRNKHTRHNDLANCIARERGLVFMFQHVQIALILTYSYSKLWPEPSMVYKTLDAQSHCFKSIVSAREFIGRKVIWQE